MKYLKLFLSMTIIANLFLFGCVEFDDSDDKNQQEEPQYKFETFEILKTDYNTITKPTADFNSIKSYKNQLKIKSVPITRESGTDTRENIYDFLIDTGYTSSEANDEFDKLDKIGNTVLVFTMVEDSSKYFILYIEK